MGFDVSRYIYAKGIILLKTGVLKTMFLFLVTRLITVGIFINWSLHTTSHITYTVTLLRHRQVTTN